ncbi:MAG TPA: tetratricopeptide repeat protein [Pyrinomonadaceae bacterium]|nr:tetratricopeptide repeat protein [Pyrinomonadaceae bacterium]
MFTRRPLARAAAPLCLLLLSALLAAPTPAAAKETWTAVRSKNFHLVGNASDKEIRRVATKLEQFRDVFTRIFPAVRFQNPVPTTVVVFKSDGAFKPYKPLVDGKTSDLAGYFQPGDDVNYIALAAERAGTENPFETIYHEYVHLLVQNNMAAVPAWFNEGLAEYYSTFEVDDERKVYLGKLVDGHVLLLRRQQQLIPLKTLFETDYHSLHRNRREAKGLFYAQAWALVHYLVLGNDGRRLEQMGRFLTLAGQGKSQEQAFREAFGTDFAGMEKELREYVRRDDFKMRVVTFDKRLEHDAEMTSRPLTEAEALFHLGDLLMHTNRLDEAAAKLREALTLAPDSAAAHASLGMTLVRQNREAEAREHLRRAVSLDSQNYLAHYYYASALSRAGLDESGRARRGYDEAAVKEMRASLRRAIELRPDFAESYRLLAFVNLVAGEQLEESVALLKRAMAAAPGRESYLFILAQIYLRQEKYEEARQAAEPLARSADPRLRADGASLLRAVEQMKEQAARFKAERERVESDGGEGAQGAPRLRRLDEDPLPPDDGRSPEERAAQAFSDALNEALRKPQAGETRAAGVLARIECGAKGLVFHVRAGERVLRLAAADFNALHIMAFTPEAGSTLTCGERKDDARAVVTYRAPKDARAKTDGELVALEFVPSGYNLKQ